LDVPGNYMYWALHEDVNGSIVRKHLDGSGQMETLVRELPNPQIVTLDLRAGKMYWTEVGNPGTNGGDIRRANLDGSNQQILVQGANGPVMVALDLDAGQMYWTEFGSGANDGFIRRANLDGTSQTILISGLNQPVGIALELPEPEMALLTGASIIVLGRRGRRLGQPRSCHEPHFLGFGESASRADSAISAGHER
jgi:hypothetical protein